MDVKFSRYDSADYLDSEESIAAYLDDLQSDGDDGAAQLARALGVVARARMLTQLARDAHMRRRELVDAFTAVYPPSPETLTKIARALGLNDLDFSRVKSDPPWWVRNVIPLPGYRLAVQFQDGVSGVVDLSAMVESPEPGSFTVLREPGAFDAVYVADGMVTWPDEADLPHDVMHRTLKERGEWIVTAAHDGR
jgi:probable addiction module antidote protein